MRAKIAAIKAHNRENPLNKVEIAGALGEGHLTDNRTVRILHVEDDRTVAEMAKEMLEIQGWQVETCGDGHSALARISGEADYDVFLVDYDLPGINGLELVRHARKIDRCYRTPIVMLSATPVQAEARAAGADVFLQKPQDIGSLVETINIVLGKGEQDVTGD